MATTTPNFGWPVPTSTDLVKDGATAIEGLGDAIDASLLDLKGGTSGQVLAKNSNTDMDFVWVTTDDTNAIQNAIVDAKGDLIGATAADTPARLAVGTNGQVLTADSTTATGLKWATAGGGDLVLTATGSFSAASTISVNNCFSSTYDYYKIYVDLSSGTTQNVDLRLRVGGSDNSTSNYNIQYLYLNNTTNNAGRDTAQTGFRIGTAFSGAEVNYSEITVFNPFLSENTGFIVNCASRSGTAQELQLFNGNHAVASSFDGFTIYNGGNKTGKYRVYGFKN